MKTGNKDANMIMFIIIIKSVCIASFVALITYFNGLFWITSEGDFNPLGTIVTVVLIVVINVIVGLVDYRLQKKKGIL